MKQIAALIFAGLAFFLIACALIASRQKQTRRVVRIIIALSAVTAFCNAIITGTESPYIAFYAYSLYYPLLALILSIIFSFYLDYTNIKHNKKIKQALLIILNSVNFLAFALNAYFKWTMLPTAITYENEIFIAINHNNLLVFYDFFLGDGCILASIAVLLYRMLRSAKVYISRYIFLLLANLLIVVWNALSIQLKRPIDYSTIGFTLFIFLFYYYSSVFKNRSLTEKMLSKVVLSSVDFVFFFDADNNCIFANNAAREFFLIQDENLQDSYEVLNMWLKDTSFNPEKDNEEITISRQWMGEKVFLLFRFNRLWENGKLIGTFFHINDETERVLDYERRLYQANHDALTGLYNRDYLFRKIRERLEKDPDTEYVLFVSDIKEFKLINEIFGREIADDFLKKIAEMMRLSCGTRIVYGRIGIDRFCTLIKKKEFTPDLFLSIQDTLTHLHEDLHYHFVAHGGVYNITNRSLPISTMVARALMAIQSIKNSVDQRIAFYDEGMREKRLWAQKVTSEMDTALNSNQFTIYLQPQANKEKEIKGAEVLVRWNHPHEGMIPPAEFIHIFEENGMITKLDMFVWEQTCIVLKKWKEMGKTDFYLSVNISPRDFYYVDVVETFKNLIQKYEISPANLKLEITETVMITDLDNKLKVIDDLHDAGFLVEMDDFGSGYSSLNMLKDIPVDILKIDMAFLYRAKDIQRSQTIIRQVVSLSKELGIPVITEGVETEDQVSFLVGIGCNMFQGYYFAKPLPLEEFEKKYLFTTGTDLKMTSEQNKEQD